MSEKIIATSLARVMRFIQEYDCGTISACRTYSAEAYYKYGSAGVGNLSARELEKYLVPPRVNKKNTFLLRQKITALGFGVLPITGVYQEKGADLSKETSFFVFDISRKGNLKKSLLYLGNLFEQDSITYADAGRDFKLLDTTPFFEEPRFEKHKASGIVIDSFRGVGYHTPSSADVGQFFSRLKNKAFFWKNITDVGDEIEASLRVPYISPQARVGYRHGVLQSSIWTKASLFAHSDLLIEAGADVNTQYDLNIIDDALTERGIADPLYVERD